jgi:hypothetical protein
VSPWTIAADQRCCVKTCFELLAAADAELGDGAAVPLQRDVRRDLEAGEDLIGHLAVLAGVQPLHGQVTVGTHGVIERRELDDLRTGAGYEQNVFHSRGGLAHRRSLSA